MHDPTIGRFLQRDPYGYIDSMNLYSYVTNDPLNWIDPYGLEAFCPLGIDSNFPAFLGIGVQTGIIFGSFAFPGPDEFIVIPVLILVDGLVLSAWLINEYLSPAFNDWIHYSKGKNPFKGKPGSSSSSTNSSGGKKQDRKYGDDGYPEKDIDYDHYDNGLKPHEHDWDRPPDGGPPTAEDRGPGQPLSE